MMGRIGTLVFVALVAFSCGQLVQRCVEQHYYERKMQEERDMARELMRTAIVEAKARGFEEGLCHGINSEIAGAEIVIASNNVVQVEIVRETNFVGSAETVIHADDNTQESK